MNTADLLLRCFSLHFTGNVKLVYSHVVVSSKEEAGPSKCDF
jgi:hypothetical protein